uniref:Uncharacterized protein n=1 Tax=viral metagenome TaxID=1070528 RepID=A0A6M3KHG5_9ZZZZ
MRVALFLCLVFVAAVCFAQGEAYKVDDSPYNIRNSPYNIENSPYNVENSPYNVKNSPYNVNSERIIRDNSGKAVGYAVEKKDGGVNYFDSEGNRIGYK